MSMFSYGFLYNSTNNDFTNTVQLVVERAAKFNITDESYQLALKQFEDSNESISNISRPITANMRTEVIKSMVRERQLALRSIQMLVKASLTHSDDETMKHAKALEFWLRPFKKEFYHPLMRSHTHAVRKLDSTLNENPKVAEALRYFSLEERFDKILRLTDEIPYLNSKRGNEVTENRKDTLEWRRDAIKNLKNLFFILEFLIQAKGDDNPIYLEAAKSLQSTLKRHERIYRIKKGMRQGRKERERLKSIAAQESAKQSDVQTGAQYADQHEVYSDEKDVKKEAASTKSQEVAQTIVKSNMKSQSETNAQDDVQLKSQEVKQSAKDDVAPG